MKPFFFLTLFLLLLGLSAAILGTAFGVLTAGSSAHYFIPGHSLVGGLIGLSSFLTIIIPLGAVFYFLTRFIRPYQLPYNFRRGVRFTWLAAFFITLYGAIDTFKSFKDSDTYMSSQTYDISQDEIIVDIVNPDNYYSSLVNFGDLHVSGTKLYSDDVYIRIEKAEDDQLLIEERIRAYGNNSHNAIMNAQAVGHQIEVKDDGTIKVPSRFYIEKGKKFRGQTIEYKIYVPEGKKISFDDRAQHYIISSAFDDNVERPHQLKKYTWTMGENGLIAKSWLKENKYSKDLEIKGANTLNIKGDFEIDIVRSKEASVSLVGRQEIVDQIAQVKQDNILSIVDENEIIDYPVKVYIRIPELSTLSTSTDQNIRIEGFNQSSLDILLTGDSHLNAYLDVENLTLTSERRAEVNLTGEGQTLLVDMDYHAEINAENYPVDILLLKRKIADAKFKVNKMIKSIKNLDYRTKVYGDPEIRIGNDVFEERTEQKVEPLPQAETTTLVTPNSEAIVSSK